MEFFSPGVANIDDLIQLGLLDLICGRLEDGAAKLRNVLTSADSSKMQRLRIVPHYKLICEQLSRPLEVKWADETMWQDISGFSVQRGFWPEFAGTEHGRSMIYAPREKLDHAYLFDLMGQATIAFEEAEGAASENSVSCEAVLVSAFLAIKLGQPGKGQDLMTTIASYLGRPNAPAGLLKFREEIEERMSGAGK